MNRLLEDMKWLLVFVLAISLFFAGILVNDARKDIRIATRYDHMERTAGHLIVAAGWQALERGTGATMLGSGQPSAELAARFNDVGKKGDFQVSEALEELDSLFAEAPDANLRARREVWQKAYKGLLESRGKVVTAGIAKMDWINAATDNIEAEIHLWDAVFTPRDAREQVLYFNSVVRGNLAMLCEYAGRERANLGNLIAAGQPVPPELLETLMSYRAIVDHMVRQVVELKKDPSMPPDLVTAIDAFEKEFLGSYQQLRQEVYAASRGKQPYPVNGPQWIERATKAINSGLHISEVIGAQSAKAAADIRFKSRATIAFNTGLFLFAFAVSVFAIHFMRRKVIVPINRVMHENARLAGAVHHTADAVIITDTEGNIEYVNPAFEEMTGYRTDDIQGKNPRIQKSGKQDRAFYEELWKTIKAGRIWRGKIINRKKNGSLYEEEMTISPITDAAGAIVNFVAVKRDVTREAILQKSRIYFTDITAHELRTPLTKLHLVENMLKQVETAGAVGGSLGDVRNALLESMAAFDRIANATSLISDMTRTGAERPLIGGFIYFDIAGALENAQGNIEDARRKIRIEADLAELPRQSGVLGNRVMILQALDEVLSNAIKFTPDGKTVRVRAYSGGGLVHIEVADEGEGIPEDKLRDVFIPYYALESSLMHSTGRYKFHGGGLGLGLTMVKLIMEYHNGTIAIGNRTDRAGTLVILTFPLAARNSAPDEKPSTSSEGLG